MTKPPTKPVKPITRVEILRAGVHLAGATVTGLGLIACGPLRPGTQPSPKIDSATVELWHYCAPGAACDPGQLDLLERFRQAMPQITVQRVQVPAVEAEYVAKVLAAASAGTPPEVVGGTVGHIPTFASLKLLEPVETLFKGMRDWRVDDYMEGPRAAFTVGGQMVAAPYFAEVMGIGLNLEALTKVGLQPPTAAWTWLQCTDYMVRTTRPGGEVTQWGLASPTAGDVQTANFFNVLLRNNGGEWLDKSFKEPLFHRAEGVEALEFWMDLVRRGATPAPPPSGRSPFALFSTGEAAFFAPNWTTQLSVMQRDITSFQWGTVMPPRKKQPMAHLGSHSWAVLKAARQRAAAAEFVRFSALPTSLVGYALITKGLPTRRTAQQEPQWQSALQTDLRLRVHWDGAQFGKVYPAIPRWAEALTLVGQAIGRVLAGGVSAKTALEDVARQVAAQIIQTSTK